jgi:hypothetical protein
VGKLNRSLFLIERFDAELFRAAVIMLGWPIAPGGGVQMLKVALGVPGIPGIKPKGPRRGV